MSTRPRFSFRITDQSETREQVVAAAKIMIGRVGSAELRIDGEGVYRMHATIQVDGGGIPILTDLGSRTGTRLDGERVNSAPLTPGSVIEIGDIRIEVLTIDGVSEPPRPQPPAPRQKQARPGPAESLCLNFRRELDGLRYEQRCWGPIFTIGQRPYAGLSLVRIEGAGVYPTHAAVEVVDGVAYLIDHGSPAGTRLNGQPISRAALAEGDVIGLGDQQVEVVEIRPAEPRARRDVPLPRPRPDPLDTPPHVPPSDSDAEVAMELTGLTFAAASRQTAAPAPELRELYTTAVETLPGLERVRPALTLALLLGAGLPPEATAVEWIEHACTALGRDEATRALLPMTADLPGFSRAAAAALQGSGADDPILIALLGHPFWRVRVDAAQTARLAPDVRARAMATAWWHASTSGAPLDMRPLGLLAPSPPSADDWPTRAAPVGGLYDVPALAPWREGLVAPCADQRAWTIRAMDTACDPADVLALGLADQLDRQLAAAGYPRTAVDWTAWAARVPDLPVEDIARDAWLRDHADDLGAGSLPAGLRATLDGGPPALALEPPRLTLPDRAGLIALEEAYLQRATKWLQALAANAPS